MSAPTVVAAESAPRAETYAALYPAERRRIRMLRAALEERVKRIIESGVNPDPATTTDGIDDLFTRVRRWETGSRRAVLREILAEEPPTPSLDEAGLARLADLVLFGVHPATPQDWLCSSDEVTDEYPPLGSAADVLAWFVERRKIPPNLELVFIDAVEEFLPGFHATASAHKPSFERIVLGLSDRDVRELLREIDTKYLALALKHAEPEVREKIFRNMTKRAVKMLVYDMECMGAVRPVDSLDAQHRIANIAVKLIEDGSIAGPAV